MIANSAISKLAVRYQTTELNVRREYMQHLFLSYFYQQPQTKEIYFKGGTALRIVYGSPRFSEDLDFGSTLHDIDEIEKAVLDTLIEVNREGIDSEIVESKKTSGGYLAIVDFKLGFSTVRLRFEVSFREHELDGQADTIAGDFAPPFIINSLAQEQLVAGKLAALQGRKKPRDFYDLYFLLQKGLISPKQKTQLRAILPLATETSINFSGELQQFLPKSQWAIIKDFKATLERAIRRFV